MTKIKLPIISIITISLSVIAFISCSNDDQKVQADKEVLKNEISTTLKLGTTKFVENHLVITNSIVKILAVQKRNTLNKSALNKINNITDLKEMKTFFANYGIQNADELIRLYQKQESNFISFIDENPEFINLTETQRIELIENEINNSFKSTKINSQILARSCTEQYNIDMKRCNRDYAVNLGLSWVATVGTGGWGALGFVAAVIAYDNCESDAIEDAVDCRN